jgi:hypothetical protein
MATTAPRVTASSLVRDAIGLFGLTGQVLLTIVLLLDILPDFFLTIMMQNSPEAGSWILIPAIIAQIAATGAIFYTIMQAGNGQFISLGGAIQFGASDLTAITIILLASALFVFVGAIFFIIPGFVLNAVATLCICIRVNERCRLSSLFQRGWAVFRLNPVPITILLSLFLLPQLGLILLSLYPPEAIMQSSGALSTGAQLIIDAAVSLLSLPPALIASAYYLRVVGTSNQRTAKAFD